MGLNQSLALLSFKIHLKSMRKTTVPGKTSFLLQLQKKKRNAGFINNKKST